MVVWIPTSNRTLRGPDLVGILVVVLSVTRVATVLVQDPGRTNGLLGVRGHSKMNITSAGETWKYSYRDETSSHMYQRRHRVIPHRNDSSVVRVPDGYRPEVPSAGVNTSLSTNKSFVDAKDDSCSCMATNVCVFSKRQYRVFQIPMNDSITFMDYIRRAHDVVCQDLWGFFLMGAETHRELNDFITCMFCNDRYDFGITQNKTHIITGGFVQIPAGGVLVSEWYIYGYWLDWDTYTRKDVPDEVVLLDSTTGKELPDSKHIHEGDYGILLLGSMDYQCSPDGSTYRRWGLLKLEATGNALRAIGHAMCERLDPSTSPATTATTPTTTPTTTASTSATSTPSITTSITTTPTTIKTTTLSSSSSSSSSTSSTSFSTSTLTEEGTSTPFPVPPDCCVLPLQDGRKLTKEDVLCPEHQQEIPCPEGFVGVVVVACEGRLPPTISILNNTCAHLWLEEVDSLIDEGTTPAKDIADSVLLHTDPGSSLTPNDLERLTTVLHNLTLLQKKQVEDEVDASSRVTLVKSYAETILKIVDSVIANVALWDQVEEESVVILGPKLLQEMELTSFLLAEMMPISKAMNHTMKSLTLHVVVYSVPKIEVPDVPIFFPDREATSYIQLPPGFKDLLDKDSEKEEEGEQEAGKEEESRKGKKDEEEEMEEEEEDEEDEAEEEKAEEEKEEEEDKDRGKTSEEKKHHIKRTKEMESTQDSQDNEQKSENEGMKDQMRRDQERRREYDKQNGSAPEGALEEENHPKKLSPEYTKPTTKKRDKEIRRKDDQEMEAGDDVVFVTEVKQARPNKGVSAKEAKKVRHDEATFAIQTTTGEDNKPDLNSELQRNDEQLNTDGENSTKVSKKTHIDARTFVIVGKNQSDALLARKIAGEASASRPEGEGDDMTSGSQEGGISQKDCKPTRDPKDPIHLVAYLLKGTAARRIMPGSANTLHYGGGRTVNSDVMSMTVGAPGLRLNFPRGADGAVIELKHRLHEKGPPYRDVYRELGSSSGADEESAVVGSTRCVFWDFQQRKWSPVGCAVARRGRDNTRCECRHLTMFAVLTDTHHYLGRDNTLDILGTTLSAASCVGLLLAFVVLSCTRGLSSVRTNITRQLCVSLGLSHLFLILFLDPTVLDMSEDGCLVAAMFIHYFVMSAVSWMLIEGLHLLMVVTCTFASFTHHLPTYWLIGYGSPAVIVAVTALVAYGTSPDAWENQLAYGDLHNGAFCWLSTENGFIWAFTGPLILVIVFNTVSLVAALRSAAVLEANRQKSLPQQMKVWVKGCFSLNCILGITWVFGFMYLEEDHVFAYVFTVLNASQGVLIFVLNCLVNDQVRSAILGKVFQVKGKLMRKQSTVLSGTSNPGFPRPYHNHHVHHNKPPHHSTTTTTGRHPFGRSPSGYGSRRSDRTGDPWRNTLTAAPDIRPAYLGSSSDIRSRYLGSSLELSSHRSRSGSSTAPLGRPPCQERGFEPGRRSYAIAGFERRLMRGGSTLRPPERPLPPPTGGQMEGEHLDFLCECQAAVSPLSVSGSPVGHLHRKTRNASAWSADTQLSVLSDSISTDSGGHGNFNRRISSDSGSSFSSLDSTSSCSSSSGPPQPHHRPSAAPLSHDAFCHATPTLWQVALRLEGEIEDISNSPVEHYRFIPEFESIPEKDERRD